jgi:hypothetical protein
MLAVLLGGLWATMIPTPTDARLRVHPSDFSFYGCFFADISARVPTERHLNHWKKLLAEFLEPTSPFLFLIYIGYFFWTFVCVPHEPNVN